MADDAASSTAPADTATSTTATSTTLPAQAGASTATGKADTANQNGGGQDAATLTEIKALADELGITPGQLKGRLEASKKWEDRSKANNQRADETAQQLTKLQDQMTQIAKIFGGADDKTITPEALQAQIAQRDELVRDMQVERAAERAAVAAKADPELLVPALFYKGKLEGLDPSAADFDEKLKAIVEDAAKDPKFRAAAEFPDLRQGNQGQSAAAGAQDPNAWLRRMAGR